MNQNEAKEIFLKALPGLTEPLKSAVEFTLANWHKLDLDLKFLEDLPHEEWRDVVGYEGLYKVSNFGRVKSFCNNGVRILNPSSTENPGYYVVNLTKNGNQRTRYVHILVAQAFLPNPENKSYVNHINGDKLNNCVENLKWTTPMENARHAWETGLATSRKGSENKHSKLMPDQVRYIRKNYKPRDKEFGRVALARKFGVSKSTIYFLLSCRTYQDVV